MHILVTSFFTLLLLFNEGYARIVAPGDVNGFDRGMIGIDCSRWSR